MIPDPKTTHSEDIRTLPVSSESIISSIVQPLLSYLNELIIEFPGTLQSSFDRIVETRGRPNTTSWSLHVRAVTAERWMSISYVAVRTPTNDGDWNAITNFWDKTNKTNIVRDITRSQQPPSVDVK
ncbi:hypothetical protein QTP88_015989 [Uroleucon formosanum]